MSSLFANACAPALLADACAPALLAVPVVSGALEAPVAVPVWIELIAIVVASVSGALTAREKKLDLVGAVCLAALCSLGGGLLRDMTLQVGDVYILNQPLAMPAAILTAAIVFIAPSVVAKQDRLIAVLDIFAVGLYAATGADKAKSIKDAKVTAFNTTSDAFMALSTGSADAVILDRPVIGYFLKSQPKLAKNLQLQPAMEDAASFGFAVKKDNTALLEKLNKAYDELEASGEARKIFEKWFAE